jgi:hypothetical protein
MQWVVGSGKEMSLLYRRRFLRLTL